MRRVEVTTDIAFRECIDDDPRGRFVMADEAESECAALRAEVERLRSELEHELHYGPTHAEWQAAESSLAAATELLRDTEDCRDFGEFLNEHRPRIQAFLAAQPAAPARDELAACRAEVARLQGLMCRKPEATDPDAGRHALAPDSGDRFRT